MSFFLLCFSSPLERPLLTVALRTISRNKQAPPNTLRPTNSPLPRRQVVELSNAGKSSLHYVTAVYQILWKHLLFDKQVVLEEDRAFYIARELWREHWLAYLSVLLFTEKCNVLLSDPCQWKAKPSLHQPGAQVMASHCSVWESVRR